MDNINKKLDSIKTEFIRHIEEDKLSNDKHIELLSKISEQVHETQKCISKLDKKVDLSIQSLQYEIKAINELDKIQNAELKRHIEGVQGNRGSIDDIKKLVLSHKNEWDSRILDLEAPKKAKKLAKGWVIDLGKVAVAVVAIWKMLEVFGVLK